MRRMVIIFALVVGALTLAASGLADPGGKGKAKTRARLRGRTSSASR